MAYALTTLLDANGGAIPPAPPPAPPKDERLDPNPKLAKALRDLAELADQGYLIAFAAVGLAHDQDPQAMFPNTFTFLHDAAAVRVQQIGALNLLAQTLGETQIRQMMQSQARTMARAH
jgi:hypothetical protein